MTKRVLKQKFYAREPKIVARDLIGCTLVSTIGGKKTAGVIFETEAYLSRGDSACHGFRGETPKNRTMFLQAGLSYVYPIHAKFCFNVVTETIALPSAVLIRALEPIIGMPVMRKRRNSEAIRNLCSGPAKICQALGIDRAQDGNDLTRRKQLWLEPGETSFTLIKRTVRIGVTSAENRKLRFVAAGHEFASGPKYLR